MQKEIAKIGSEAGFVRVLSGALRKPTLIDLLSWQLSDTSAVADGHSDRVHARYILEAGGRPGDVKVEQFFVAGSDVVDTSVYVNVTVTSPFTPSAISSDAT